MTTHLDDELLAKWALGEETPDASGTAHLQDCDRCTANLAELRRLLDVMDDLPQLESPGSEVWSRINDELSLDPDRAESAPVRRRFTGRALAVAATVAAVVGAGIGVVATNLGDKPTVEAAVPLSPLEGRSGAGTADLLAGDKLKVTASGLAGGSGFYEVWLINTDGKRMVSLGVLNADATGTFQIPGRVTQQGYRIVDISLEPDDGNPEHSRNSIIRGTLPA